MTLSAPTADSAIRDTRTRSFGKSFKFTLSVGGFKDLPKLRVLVSLMALRRSAPTAPSEIPEPVRFPCPAGLDIVEPLVQIEGEAVSTEAVSTNGEEPYSAPKPSASARFDGFGHFSERYTMRGVQNCYIGLSLYRSI